MKKKSFLIQNRVQLSVMLCLAFFMFGSEFALAQDIGSGIGEAANQIKNAKTQVKTLIYAIAGVVGLIGAVRVYIKWNSGDQDVQKSAMGWFGAAIFLVVVAGTVDTFFGK